MAYHEAVGAMQRLELLRKIQARTATGPLGIHPGQPPLLHYIQDHPGCTQKEAADELDVTPASAAASLKRLEKAGLVTYTHGTYQKATDVLGFFGYSVARPEVLKRRMDALTK